MKLKTLRYFLAVAREENMTKAAETLHVTQPTLSKQLGSLEEELGKKLFNRHAFSIELTDEGYLLRKRAEDLIEMADKITNEFSALDNLSGGDIYFGLAESYQISYLAKGIKKFKKKCPDLHYHITSGGTEQVTERLDKGILDFAILVEPPDYNKYNAIEFPDTDVWGIVVPESHPLASKKSITVDDLVGLPLFCSEQSWVADIPRWAGSKMQELHLEGSFPLSYNGGIFAKENLGILLTFDKLINTGNDSNLAFRPLKPQLENKMYLVWKKYQIFSPIAEKFLTEIRNHIEKSVENHS